MRLILSLFFALQILFGFAQSEKLARNYMRSGAYDKAVVVLKEAHAKFPMRMQLLFDLVAAHQQLEQYDQAKELLEKRIKKTPELPQLHAELGHNFELQDRKKEAQKNYNKAITLVQSRPNYASRLGSTFEKYNLLNEAIDVYTLAMDANPNLNFNGQLARIFGEQGDLEKMFDSYLSLIDSNPLYFNKAQHHFNQFIEKDPLNAANSIFRKLLLRKLQQKPSTLYNQMLSWLFIQQGDFKKAFAQEKAIYKRTEEGLQGFMDLVMITIDAGAYEQAKEILAYVLDEPGSPESKLAAHQIGLQLDTQQTKKTDKKEFQRIAERYRDLFETYGRGGMTLSLQLDYAHVLAFELDEAREAISFLKKSLKQRLNRYQTAQVRMKLADILVLNQRFNEALIYYTQIQNAIKNDVIAQEARFKVAKTSYYKGDFKWAQTQLDVLKASTSQLIANDAMELSLVIDDNIEEDSIQTGLKRFAKADLLRFQNKPKEAIAVFSKILIVHSGEKIEDDALYHQATLFETTEQYEKARKNYEKIIELFGDSVMIDDAYYRLAELYAGALDEPEKAKEYYQQLLFHHADSIYFVEARKKFRKLRGDVVH